jgi:hypothetical protein
MLGCSGEALQKISWLDTEKLGGVLSRGKPLANARPRTIALHTQLPERSEAATSRFKLIVAGDRRSVPR